MILYVFVLLNSIFQGTGSTPPYTPTDLILVGCGASANLNDRSQRVWGRDEGSKYTPSNAANISWAAAATRMDPSVPNVPYQTARFFRSSFIYTFPLAAGHKFLRLHFYPTNYSGFDTSLSFFSLKANHFTLLSNFSAFLHSSTSLVKEFLINVEGNQRLVLNFSPNPNSFAFVNGIEIVSVPDKLYFRGSDVPIKNLDQQLFYLDHYTTLESLYRLNVGGAYVGVGDDTGMFRSWSPDDDYINFGDFGWTPHREDLTINYTEQTPPYTAPTLVYISARVMNNQSISLEWGFPVDSGFPYLLRLHFCEFLQEVTNQNQRVFTININNQTIEPVLDVIFQAGGHRIPIFRDYVIWIPDEDGHRGKQDIALSLFPRPESHAEYLNVLLNGLEIFKLNDTKGSLAAANPPPRLIDSPLPPPPQGKKSGGSSKIYPVIGSLAGLLAVVAIVAFFILRRRRRVKDSTTSVTKSSWIPLSTGSTSTARTGGSTGVSLPSDLCRQFSIEEIKTATRNFDDKFVIGRGGFGNVYRGLIDDAANSVAIKRLNPSSNQGAREFLTEIDMLSKLRHLHLVSLIGYCDDNGEMILVYDYMGHGTLRDHLYNTANPPLSWKQRLHICLGSAKGIDYLHTGAKHPIIHRDIKTTNILLDDKWVAKVSDFGLSKVGPTAGGAQTHVSTVVKGSFGYVDPEYYRRHQLTLKSDVYSFGVVLFEVLCARPPIITTLPREQMNLAEWAKFCYRKGTLDQIIDPNLKGQIAPECLINFAEIAFACLRDKGIDRPSMNDIVWKLEFAMQLQEQAESRGRDGGEDGDGDGDGDSDVDVDVFTAMNPLRGIGVSDTTDEDTFSRSKSSEFSTSTTTNSEKLKSGDAFSEIINPLGR